MDFYTLLIQSALAEGFPLAGALDLDRADHADFPGHVARYDRWLAQGYAGTMDYLARGRDRRADPRQLFPDAQSILCVAIPYRPQAAGAVDSATGPRYARYLSGSDYHRDIPARLEKVMARVAASWPASATLSWKVCVDTSAVLERSWAALAGLGWIGKNTLLIHPQHGSYLFLGEVLISERTGQGPRPLPNYCGGCRRCLDACPTDAFAEVGVLDSNRCIAYWTLEKRGALEISDSQKTAIGTWVAGCDLCQEACPFNRKPARAPTAPETGAPNATSRRTWEDLLDESSEAYTARIRESALKRVKPAQFSRNLAIALANAIAANPQGASDWLRLRPRIRERYERETDGIAKAEWHRALALFPES